jgi:hypothetical protein
MTKTPDELRDEFYKKLSQYSFNEDRLLMSEFDYEKEFDEKQQKLKKSLWNWILDNFKPKNK